MTIPQPPYADPTGRLTPAGQALVASVIPLAFSCAAKVAPLLRSASMAEELQGYALEILCTHAGKYDPTRGMPTTFFRPYLMLYLGRWVARENRRPDQVGAGGADVPVVAAEPTDAADVIRSALDDLSAADRDLVESYFGIGDPPGEATLKELAARYGITKEGVRLRLRKVLERLRVPLGGL